jgi:FtsZ-interacting cell division protein ZipA
VAHLNFNTAAHSHHALQEKELMESILKTGFKPDVIRFHRLPTASGEGEGPRAPGRALWLPERDHVAT